MPIVSQHLEQAEYDAERSRYFESLGYKVIPQGDDVRLWNNDVMKDFRSQFMKDIDKISFCNNCPYKGQVVWDPTVDYHWLTEAARA